MKIRILHFIDTLGAGGSERQLVYLLENLDRDRYDCHVLTIYDSFRHYESTLTKLGIPLYSLHHGDLTTTNRGKAITGYARLMWTLRPHILHGWLHYPNLIARTMRPICPPHRLITAIRSNYSDAQLRNEKLTACLSDFRIVNREILANEYPGKPTPLTIKNGINISKFSQQKPNLENTNTKPPLKILIPARIDPNKGHLILLESLRKTELPSGTKITLIGDITDTQTQSQIDTIIRKYGLDHLINQLPATSDIASYYHNTDFVLLPSISESFPNVILESFASFKPIIVSEAANNTNIVEHGINGWIFPTGNSDALAKCLTIAAKTTPEERKCMEEHGHAIAEQYTIEKMVANYTSLYERALKDS